MPPEVFASLAGAPHDPQLRTFVKVGAWVTVHGLDTAALCGVEDTYELSARGRSFPGSRTMFKPEESVTLKFKPATGTLSVHGGCVVY